jgi:hypothetical protein
MKRALAIALVLSVVGSLNISGTDAVRAIRFNASSLEAKQSNGYELHGLFGRVVRRMLQDCFSSIACPLPTVPTEQQPTTPALRPADPAELLKEGVRVAKLRIADGRAVERHRA